MSLPRRQVVEELLSGNPHIEKDSARSIADGAMMEAASICVGQMVSFWQIHLCPHRAWHGAMLRNRPCSPGPQGTHRRSPPLEGCAGQGMPGCGPGDQLCGPWGDGEQLALWQGWAAWNTGCFNELICQ